MPEQMTAEKLAEIRSVNLLELMSERAAGQISGYLAALLARVAELEAERHTTNEALDDAVAAIREKAARIGELEKAAALVAEFVAKRAEYITAIRNCHPDNGHDYDRWQGHAAARRQLAEALGLPVAWPAEDAAKAVSK